MITLLSCMCYYHSCVQYLKLIVLYWNFLLLCVWTDICTLYLFYVSEINIYYYYIIQTAFGTSIIDATYIVHDERKILFLRHQMSQ